jgi:hypothetical protein
MEKDYMGGAFSLQWRYEKFIGILIRKPKGRDHFADLG